MTDSPIAQLIQALRQSDELVMVIKRSHVAPEIAEFIDVTLLRVTRDLCKIRDDLFVLAAVCRSNDGVPAAKSD